MSLLGSGMRYGHSHGNANLPLILSGALILDFSTEVILISTKATLKAINLMIQASTTASAADRQLDGHMSNLLLLMANKNGWETDKFGDNSVINV